MFRADRASRVRAHLLWTVNPLMIWSLIAAGHLDVLAAAVGVAGLLIVDRRVDGRRVDGLRVDGLWFDGRRPWLAAAAAGLLRGCRGRHQGGLPAVRAGDRLGAAPPTRPAAGGCAAAGPPPSCCPRMRRCGHGRSQGPGRAAPRSCMWIRLLRVLPPPARHQPARRGPAGRLPGPVPLACLALARMPAGFQEPSGGPGGAGAQRGLAAAVAAPVRLVQRDNHLRARVLPGVPAGLDSRGLAQRDHHRRHARPRDREERHPEPRAGRHPVPEPRPPRAAGDARSSDGLRHPVHQPALGRARACGDQRPRRAPILASSAGGVSDAPLRSTMQAKIWSPGNRRAAYRGPSASMPGRW